MLTGRLIWTSYKQSPEFDLYDKDWPIRTHQEQNPPAKTMFNKNLPDGRTDMILNSIVSGGCIISGAKVEGCILSPDVRVDTQFRNLRFNYNGECQDR